MSLETQLKKLEEQFRSGGDKSSDSESSDSQNISINTSSILSSKKVLVSIAIIIPLIIASILYLVKPSFVTIRKRRKQELSLNKLILWTIIITFLMYLLGYGIKKFC